MKKLIGFCILILFIARCQKMARGKIYPADSEYYTDGDPGAGLDFLRKLTGNKMHDHLSRIYNIKFPDSFLHRPAAWGIFYFTGMKSHTTSPNIFYIVLDYCDSVSRIIFDKNGNADFNDDSLMLIEAGKKFTTTISNLTNSKARAEFNMVLGQNANGGNYGWLYRGMNRKFQDCISPSLVIQFKERNYRKIHLPDSNTITLYDRNYNGLFNDRYDMIIAGDISENKSIKYNTVRTKFLKHAKELVFENNTYRLVNVNKYGNSVEVEALNKLSDTTEKLPAFSFLNEKNLGKIFKTNSSKKFTVLYIWGSWCIGCITQAPEFVKLREKHKNKIDFFTLNYGDKTDRMEKYISQHNYFFNRWKLDDNNVQKLHPEGFPHYIVVDSRNRIVFRTLNVLELGDFISRNQAETYQ